MKHLTCDAAASEAARAMSLGAVLLMALPACGLDPPTGEGTGVGGGSTGMGGSSSAFSPSVATSAGGTGAAPSAAATTGTGGEPDCTADAEVHSGDGTYYAADGTGNCGFAATGDLLVGAMNQFDYAASSVCGACARIQGPAGAVKVRIVDKCPECLPGDIDLSPLAFGYLAALDLGRIPIDWTFIPCDVQGPIVYHFKEGSNAWWTAVQIRNTRYAISSLEVRREGQYAPVPRVDYNFFVEDSGMGPGPYQLRVTDARGQVLEDLGVPLVPGGDHPGSGQFAACLGD